MRERYSPAVRRILEQLGVDAEGASTAVPLPVLLGVMIAEADGRIAQHLRHYDCLEKIHDAIPSLSPAASVDLSTLLDRARLLGREHDSEGTITSDFFLVTLTEFNDEVTGFFKSIGVDPDRLRQDILGESFPLTLPAPLSLACDLTDRHDVARVLDVNLNRSREALRVLDDYCRFVGGDALMTEQVKRTRHELAELAECLPAGLLIAARDTAGDVGTGISTEREMSRSSSAEVARIAMKRLQESLRSLEEYGKTFDSTFAAGIEQLRYRCYTLEKGLLRGDARRVLNDCRLYVLLTGSQCVAALDWTIAEAAAGGASAFQLREKSLDDRQLLQRARDVRRWTRAAGAIFIMNDRPDIARLAEADGVHLGQDDLAVIDARRIVGSQVLIGVSTHNLDQVQRAVEDGADYIGVGPTFPSETKTFDAFAGLSFVKAACAATALPAFAIGGITASNITEVVRAGAQRVAVSAAIAKAEHPRVTAMAMRQALPL